MKEHQMAEKAAREDAERRQSAKDNEIQKKEK